MFFLFTIRNPFPKQKLACGFVRGFRCAETQGESGGMLHVRCCKSLVTRSTSPMQIVLFQIILMRCLESLVTRRTSPMLIVLFRIIYSGSSVWRCLTVARGAAVPGQWQGTWWQWQQRLALPDSGAWCCCARAVAGHVVAVAAASGAA